MYNITSQNCCELCILHCRCLLLLYCYWESVCLSLADEMIKIMYGRHSHVILTRQLWYCYSCYVTSKRNVRMLRIEYLGVLNKIFKLYFYINSIALYSNYSL